MYLLHSRIRVMLLCQHDKKSWDYCHSYLKPTTTTGRTSPQHRGVCCLRAHTVIYACMLAGCMYVCVTGESCFSYFFWKFWTPVWGSESKAAVGRFTWPPHKAKICTLNSAVTSALTLGLLCTKYRTATIDKEKQCAMWGKQQQFAGGWVISLIFMLHAI